jgi:transcription elongation factor SPT5
VGNKRKRDAKKKKQKKVKSAKSFFVQDEAEEDEEEESFGAGEITKEQEEKIIKSYDERHFMEKNKQMKITDNNVEEIAKRYDQKVIEQDEDYEFDMMDLKPKSSDPKLWLVKCKIGDEKEILANLYHKYFYFKSKEPKERLKIFSIVSYDNLKGKIFVEAFSERDVLYAITGMSNVNQNSIQIIPIEERLQIFEFDKYQKVDIRYNQIVRVKYGNYEGDLAIVLDVEDPINKIIIALVPRIYEPTKDKAFNVAPFSKMRTTLRPRQKLFNEDKKYDNNPVVSENERYGEVKKYGKFKFKNGLLIRSVRISALETENISPKDEELQNLGCFKENDVYKDKVYEEEIIVSQSKNSNIKYKSGDSIRFTSGDYKGITGTVISQKDEYIIAKLDLKDVKDDEYEFKADMVTRNFRPGEIVYIKSGKDKGNTGLVIKYVEDNQYTIYNEITKKTFTVKNTDLVLNSEIKTNNEENPVFKIGELISIKNTNIICYIIESNKFILRVVTTRNEVKQISVGEAEKKNLNKKTTYIDGKGNPISPENVVKVINGQFKGAKGTIKCIYKKYVFMHNNEYSRTNGIFCEIKDNLELLGSELLAENTDKGKVNLRRIPNNIKDLLGKTVHVVEGSWKGYNGTLIDANDKVVKLELTAKQKTIQLPFDYIKEGDINSAKDNEGLSLTPTSLSMKTPAYYLNENYQ